MPASETSERLRFIEYPGEDPREALARDVLAGLTATPKRLSCQFLYDAEGSRLFEEITRQPEYYPTRAEVSILETKAREIVSSLPEDVELVEFGGGSAKKTRILLDALFEERDRVYLETVDISRAMLEESARALLADYPGLSITAVAGEYRDGLEELGKSHERPRLILWLGSNVGNFPREEGAAFLREVADVMDPSDRVLLGVDLRKDPSVLERAYDDAAGVTRRFSKNLLARINRELGGNFDLDRFDHRAVYQDAPGRVYISLVSRAEQTVRIEGLDLDVHFDEGEAIHTEDSYKFSPAEIEALASGADLEVLQGWNEEEDRFRLNLLAPR